MPVRFPWTVGHDEVDSYRPLCSFTWCTLEWTPDTQSVRYRTCRRHFTGGDTATTTQPRLAREGDNEQGLLGGLYSVVFCYVDTQILSKTSLNMRLRYGNFDFHECVCVCFRDYN